VHAVFDYPSRIAGFLPNFQYSYLREAASLARTAPLIDPLVRIASLFTKTAARGQIAFLGSRFPGLILSVKELSPIVLGTAGSASFALRHRIHLSSVHYVHRDVFLLWKQDPMLESALAKKLIGRTTALLRRLRIKYLVVDNDSVFRHRFIIHCARHAGVTSICFQDGLFQSQQPPEFWHGHFADYMAVWGTSTAQILAKAGYDSDRLLIFGYPFPHSPAAYSRSDSASVCILGQDWENYSEALGAKKKRIFESAVTALALAGYDCSYKPHPRETDRSYAPSGCAIFSGSLEAAFDCFPTFISLSSTALLNATLAGKIAVQIYDEAFRCDRFDEKGYSFRIESTELANLPDFLHSLTGPREIPTQFILLEPSLHDRFLRLISSIKNDSTTVNDPEQSEASNKPKPAQYP
jgi:hypothetical protein